ncbi:MAG: tetratricopeptide repeat protein [Pseudomonadota bacterium]
MGKRLRLFLVSLALVAAPMATTVSADQADDRLDRLFAELAEAGPEEAAALEARIWELWSDAPSPTVDLLFERAEVAAASGDLQLSYDLLTHIVALAPSFAEGWARRAAVRVEREDLEGAIADLERALELEPRHFGAYFALGGVFVMLGEDKAAYAAFTDALKINPQLEAAREAADRLERGATGQGI